MSGQTKQTNKSTKVRVQLVIADPFSRALNGGGQVSRKSNALPSSLVDNTPEFRDRHVNGVSFSNSITHVLILEHI